MSEVAKSSKKVEKSSSAEPREHRGRKKGVPNKKTAAVIAAVEASGVTPLEHMLSVMREPMPKGNDPLARIAARELRFEAAKAAAPYVHPRLASIEHSGGLDLGKQYTDDELDAAIERAAAEAAVVITAAGAQATQLTP